MALLATRSAAKLSLGGGRARGDRDLFPSIRIASLLLMQEVGECADECGWADRGARCCCCRDDQQRNNWVIASTISNPGSGAMPAGVTLHQNAQEHGHEMVCIHGSRIAHTCARGLNRSVLTGAGGAVAAGPAARNRLVRFQMQGPVYASSTEPYAIGDVGGSFAAPTCFVEETMNLFKHPLRGASTASSPACQRPAAHAQNLTKDGSRFETFTPLRFQPTKTCAPCWSLNRPGRRRHALTNPRLVSVRARDPG